MPDERNEQPTQRRMRVVLERRKVDNIHNDLSNAATYFRKRILERIERGDREGLFLEMMAELTMIAFAVEANLNFVGDRVIEGWKEK